MKPFLFLLLLVVLGCNQAPTDSSQTVPPADQPAATDETTPAGTAGAVAKMVTGKTWQSQANPDITMEIRDGRMITMLKGAERTESPFVQFSQSCPGSKAPGEGMSGGFLCCLTLATKITTHYLVLTAETNKFEYIQDNAPDAKSEVFTLLKSE
ncbi:MAG: hypothetical protein SH848_17020 [Saprospiraceae bacterium]|nr:hypothetical protein [Saprospiraceae bacterium]MDZ4705631.1 hypothetical protein [Saprospiraceae bacterium]